MQKIFSLLLSFFATLAHAQSLVYPGLPAQWDHALPLGNGHLGCLVWQKGTSLRLSLDRSDLWDLRPMKGLDRPEFNYQWVAEQVAKGEYGIVQQYFDAPYEQEAGPTKLPGAALEFGLDLLGAPDNSSLDIRTGVATVVWKNGVRFQTFINASRNEGWYRWDFSATTDRTAKPDDFLAALRAPRYCGNADLPAGGSVAGDDLARLGYSQGIPTSTAGGLEYIYRQECWGGHHYEVAVSSRIAFPLVEGVWSISSHTPAGEQRQSALEAAREALSRGYENSLRESIAWWSAWWAASAITIPDSLMERQYYLDLYKFGCTARQEAPMISLQAVWTADNGRLPPWKGDLHHDLNTQLSYWPAYTANHLPEAEGYLNHIDRNAAAHRAFTRQYFGNDGLNIPGVSTLSGEAMGGWIQYSCSPTTAAWIAQHYYWQWAYSRDRAFLEQRAWPFLEQVANHLEAVTVWKNGQRVLPISSSPEINDNDISAWFPGTLTNYDLALIRYVFEKTAELAREMEKPKDAAHWRLLSAQLPPLALDDGGALAFAPGFPYRQSHRHFSNLMAIYPLGLLDPDNPADRHTIERSLAVIDSVGPDWWTGYSWAWLGNLRARARDGSGARDALRIFAEAFVSPNSFHVNGDQTDKGYSKMHYSPFTLEGNFAYAAGVQEMLLQSNGGVVRVFPAVPPDWRDLSFRTLRAEGAFLVSATMKDGRLQRVEIYAEKGGALRLALPDSALKQKSGPRMRKKAHWEVKMKAGETVVWER